MYRDYSSHSPAAAAAEHNMVISEKESAELPDFDTVYRRWSSYVFNTCLGVLGSPDDAQDAMQETFIQVYRRLETFRGRSSLKTWIYRIAINKCMDLHRRRPKGEQTLQEWLPNDDQSFTEDHLTEIQVRQAVLQLEPQHRVALVLFYFQQLSYEEIAEALRLSVGQVGMRLHRARKAFEEIYCGEGQL